jgi:hypothetical protein
VLRIVKRTIVAPRVLRYPRRKSRIAIQPTRATTAESDYVVAVLTGSAEPRARCTHYKLLLNPFPDDRVGHAVNTIAAAPDTNPTSRGLGHREDLPRPDALQVVLTAILEGDSRSGDQVADGG